MITVYGIKNCDTIKKALKWLELQGIAHTFHDYRKDGMEGVPLASWVAELGWELLLNSRGTTWRKLPEMQKDSIDEASALALMLEQPAMIKRPVFDFGTKQIVGFKQAEQDQIKASL
jgi:Spx/MgsR family transcriptional regulator